jgi:hypothetical protein
MVSDTDWSNLPDDNGSGVNGMSEVPPTGKNLPAAMPVRKKKPESTELEFNEFEDDRDVARRMLIQLYRRHRPSKLGGVDQLLEIYEGQEMDLVDKVREKYEGKSEAEIERIRTYMIRFYKENAPQKVKNVEPLLQIYKGKEDQLIEDMTAKYEAKQQEERNKPKPNVQKTHDIFDKIGQVAAAAGPPVDERKFKPSGTIDSNRLRGIGSKIPEPESKLSMVERMVFGEKTRTLDDSTISTSKFFSVNADQPARVGRGAHTARRSSSVPPVRRSMRAIPRAPVMPKVNIEEDKSLQIKCLDSGKETSAFDVNTEVVKTKINLKALRGRDKFIAFFQRYDPAEVDNVDRLLQHGGKQEQELWYDLQCKYQVNQRGRLLANLKIFSPEMVPRVDELLEKYKGREEALIAYYMQKARPALEAAAAAHDKATWNGGTDNSYQMLPKRDLGD